MKLILKIASLIILFPIIANAQQTTDLLYLKNGSIIKGKIITDTLNVIKIETTDGNIFAFQPIEVVRHEVLNKPLPGYIKNSGYFNYTSMGFLIGNQADENNTIFSILMEHNYQIIPYLSVGGVIGVEFFNETVAPMGVNIKGILPAKGRGIFIANASVGYSVPLEDASSENSYYEFTDTKGGIFINTDIGVVIPSKTAINLFLAMGYRYNELNYTRSDYWYETVDRKETFNRFVLRAGIMLH